jgi:transposase
MASIKAKEITLNLRVNNILLKLINKQSCPQSIVKRSKIVLMAAQGLGNMNIAKELKIDRYTARHWRNKWAEETQRLNDAVANNITDKDLNQLILDILKDEQRPGTPATFTAEQIVKIVAIACENPRDSYREVTHWTPHEIADEAVKRSIVSKISPRSVGRFFKSGSR